MKEDVWVRKFAFLPTEVGTVDGQSLSVWLQDYEVRPVTRDGMKLYEYGLSNPPQGFTGRVTGRGLDV